MLKFLCPSMRTICRDSRHQSAFTLIEVTFALVVLGGSLIVLLGLQSSLIERTLRDETTERALLLTRELLAPLESGISSTDETQSTGTFREVYGKVFPGTISLPALSEQDELFQVTYSISPWKVAGIDGDVMRKVTVTVAWGDRPIDQIKTNYFIPVT